jgi:hypothetical protein
MLGMFGHTAAWVLSPNTPTSMPQVLDFNAGQVYKKVLIEPGD